MNKKVNAFFDEAKCSAPYIGFFYRIRNNIVNQEKIEWLDERINNIELQIKSRNAPYDLIEQTIIQMHDENIISQREYRKQESCMRLIKALNEGSEKAWSIDPLLSFNKCYDIISKDKEIEDVRHEFLLAVHELDSDSLIKIHKGARGPKGIKGISPDKYFFCQTDFLFQNWNPSEDAKTIFQLMAKEKKEIMRAYDIDDSLNYGPRRLNSALAHLDYNDYIIDRNWSLGGTDYLFPQVILTEDAYLEYE